MIRLLLLAPLLVACPIVNAPSDGGVFLDAGVDAGAYPPPRDNIVARIGRDDSLDIATWNIENFPASVGTPELVADIITSLDLDLVAVQEIADEDAWQELLDRLTAFEGILSTHTYSEGNYQKVGFLYKKSVLSAAESSLLFSGSGYEFPRPPMQVLFVADDGVHEPVDFTAITVHLKAGGGNENIDRRREAVIDLERYVRSRVDGAADDDIIMLGDFNQRSDIQDGDIVFAPFADTSRYRFITKDLPSTTPSFIPGDITFDHILITSALEDELNSERARVPQLQEDISNFERIASDHLPVIVSLPIFR